MDTPPETPNIVYGRLLESVHISGYSIQRVCSELEWLMDEDRWMQVGPGYDDFNAFILTVDVSQFRIDQDHRKALATRMKELGASQRPIAQALGVHHETIGRDLRGANAPADASSTLIKDGLRSITGAYAPPAYNPMAPPEIMADDVRKQPAAKPWFQEPDKKVVQQAVNGVRREAQKIARANRSQDTPLQLDGLQHTLLCKNFASVAPDLGIFDAIITDIPYNPTGLECSRQLAEWSPKLLVQGGALAVMCGQLLMMEVLSIICETMHYRWTMAYMTPGGQSPQIWTAKVNTFWKPIFVFTNGIDPPARWLGDVINSDQNDKRFHEWGQSENGFVEIIEKLTEPGNHVLDPFMGAGTTGVAALSRGRHFTGVDVDADAVATARRRIKEEGTNDGKTGTDGLERSKDESSAP